MSAIDNLKSPPRVRRVPASRLAKEDKKVRRNLFGDVDHAALSADLDAKLAELSAEKKREWNFDFSTGEPVEGAIEWRTVSDETTPPKGVCSKLEEPSPIKFNTKVFAGVSGFKLLPTAADPPALVSSSPRSVKSILGDPAAQLRKENETTPTSPGPRKRLLNRTSAKVKTCRRKLAKPDPAEQPSIQDFYKKRKHTDLLVKKIEGDSTDSPAKRPRTDSPSTSLTGLRSVR